MCLGCVRAIVGGDMLPRLKKVLKRLGKRNVARLAFLLFYIFFGFAVPAGYACFASYPAKDAIFSEEGTASFQHRMKRGYILMVNGKNYSCGSPYAGSNPDCFASLEEHQRLVGKTISVAWFHQPVHLFTRKRRVVDIRYEGKSLLPQAFLQKSLQSDRDWAIDELIFMFFGLFLGLLFYEWLDRKRNRGVQIQ